MSAAAQASFANGSKKAVHVKWAGKTIALGTFPSAEADEKCARAKALTRAWRSSMRPKPSRDWVMLELERLGVRVVSGRLGRKAGEEGEESVAGEIKKAGQSVPQGPPGMTGQVDRSPSLGWGNSEADLSTLMARRNSLGLSMMNEAGRRGSLGSLGQVVGMDAGDPTMGQGNFGAADFQKSGEQQRRSSSIGLGSLAGGGGIGNMGMSVNPNQHYEMLKLHHMNLLNEIQETTLMMNLYQQQQLQQQQQQLQQQGGSEINGTDPQIAMLLQQQQNQGGMDPMFGAAQLQQSQRASLGLGGAQLSGNFGSQQQTLPNMMPSQQQQIQNNAGENGTAISGKDSASSAVQGRATPPDSKRQGDGGNDADSNKRTKIEEASESKN